MDGLRNLSQGAFRHHRNFYAPERPFIQLRLRAYSQRPARLETEYVSGAEAVSGLADIPTAPGAYQPEASLTILVVDRDDFEAIGMSHSDFLNAVAARKIDPCTLDLVAENWYGFYAPLATYEGRQTVFVGTVLCGLMISFNPNTMATTAICLPRNSNGFQTGEEAIAELTEILHQYASEAHSPDLLVFAALTHLARWLDRYIYQQLLDIRNVELVSGHGPYGLQDKRAGIEELTLQSKRVGGLLVTLANCARHQEIWNMMHDYLQGRLTSPSCSLDIAQDSGIKVQQANANIALTLNTLKQRVAGGISTIKYLDARTKSQSSVIFAMLTHEDAETNIRLADASKKLAEAAKRDSASMKTVAVMTMAFLPGTFFAALFALPLLQWDQEQVMQHNFWVYWAFTIPFTVVIFVIWAGFTKWERTRPKAVDEKKDTDLAEKQPTA